MNFQSELRVVKISEILISDDNYRTHFDDDAHRELSESIKKFGVLQPVIIRPFKKGFKLVSGERRIRASKMAGLTELPANIRQLTDDEAFEVMIIENLERRDVHALDEAEAFQKMIDTGRYTIPDIAAKLAKPEMYIAQRLKLNELLPELKKDFFNGEMSIGHAVHIARLSGEQQAEIYNDFKDKQVTGYGTVKDLEKEIHTNSLDLAQATFSLEDNYTCAQACTVCPKRTINNPTLFSDLQEHDSCMDKACFRKKTEEHIYEEVSDIIALGKTIMLGHCFNNKPSQEIIDMAKSAQLPILKEYSEFFPNPTNNSEQKALFYVSGPRKGQHAKVWVIKQERSAAAAPSVPVSNYSEIDRLKDNMKRENDLDEEKVHARIKEALEAEFKKQVPLPLKLNENFVEAMFIYLALNSTPNMFYLATDFKKLGIDLKLEYKTADEVMDELLALGAEQRKQIIAILLFRKCRESLTGNTLYGDIIRTLANAHSGIDVERIELEQKAKATERNKKTEAKIRQLEGKAPKKKGLSALLDVDVDGIEHVKSN